MQKLTDNQRQMVEESMGLVRYILSKYIQVIDCSEYEDLYQIGSIGLCKAAATFQSGKGFKFSTYATRCILNEIYMYMRWRRNRQMPEGWVSLDQPLAEEYGDGVFHDIVAGREDTERDLYVILLKDAMFKLKGFKRKVLMMDIEGYTQSEIASVTGVTQSYISRVLKKVKSDIRHTCEAHGSIAV